MDIDSKWSTKFHEDCMLEFFYFTSKTSFLNFQNSIRVHVRHRAFATLQLELYRVVDIDSKWSIKFHNDCMLEKFFISLLRRLLIIFNKIFKIVLGPKSGTELLQHSKLKCTV